MTLIDFQLDDAYYEYDMALVTKDPKAIAEAWQAVQEALVMHKLATGIDIKGTNLK